MTVEDPEVLTQPWTARYPMQRDESYQFFEYACHEDNTAVRNFIMTSRYERAQAAKKMSDLARGRRGRPFRGARGRASLVPCGDGRALQLARADQARCRVLGGGTESSTGVRVLKGIPFAAPPVGALRWQAPQPVAKWNGVRDASKFGNVCIQPAGPDQRARRRGSTSPSLPDSPPMPRTVCISTSGPARAAANERRPVMVYFFGGAFTEGSGSVPLYDGDALARKGAVVVTMNYRLGPYGFFVHPALTADSPHKASGNYGLMDMLASLRWVQSNIAAFGGDPNNVTVFGQSAGAMAIASLVASPEAKGLFHRAISQSGAWMGLGPSAGMRTRARAEEAGLKAARRSRRHDGRAAARDVDRRCHGEVSQRRA